LWETGNGQRGRRSWNHSSDPGESKGKPVSPLAFFKRKKGNVPNGKGGIDTGKEKRERRTKNIIVPLRRL